MLAVLRRAPPDDGDEGRRDETVQVDGYVVLRPGVCRIWRREEEHRVE